ncbi:sulfur carrier protein ThiS adenylyltransferase ThiF [Paraclostridium bifermentans]|uniref:sulfur carrier protein ThiS adenylyltransferase ThiF n=1 Tax=Paraclostridium bifermentans TaxID=1490 RepID=UPI001896E7F9|nr:sulfur carrier protein ThiS adenylyltransferase ThiF [Paraclostridium bifermentans]
MKLFINEDLKILNKNEVSINFIKDRFKKNADVVILNGYPISENKRLKDGDRVTLIKKGEIPTFEELESLMVSRHTPNIHSSLKKGKIVVLGLGGLGSNIAISLARIGVGHLILADFDVVEPSNLNRQQYFISDIGKYKTDAIKNHIKNINPFIKIDTVNKIIDSSNINEFEDVDIIMEAFDNPRYKAEIASFILKNMKDKYLISSSGMAGFYDSNIIKTRMIKERFFICGDGVNEAKEGDGLMAPRVSICANHMANLATKILIEHIK